MSVNAVSASTLKRDLATVLQQARAAATQKIDTTAAFTATSRDADTQATTDVTAKAGSTAAAPAMSSDLMSSLLQLQADFSQAGLQNGASAPGDASRASATTSASVAADSLTAQDPDQTGNSPAPAARHHAHHGRPAAPDASGGTTSTSVGADAIAASDASASSSEGESGDGLQAFLQQVTKAIGAYATGGPVGLAAAALSTTAKV